MYTYNVPESFKAEELHFQVGFSLSRVIIIVIVVVIEAKCHRSSIKYSFKITLQITRCSPFHLLPKKLQNKNTADYIIKHFSANL